MPPYAMSPHGKRMIRCGCNDLFDPHDDGTECFDGMEACKGCGKYPWYKIEAVAGGSRRVGDGRTTKRRKEVNEGFETKDGEVAEVAQDGDWLQPTVNPFGHGCCDCGLFHQVEFRIVDGNGEGENYYRNLIKSGQLVLQLRFVRDEEETARLREHQGEE